MYVLLQAYVHMTKNLMNQAEAGKFSRAKKQISKPFSYYAVVVGMKLNKVHNSCALITGEN